MATDVVMPQMGESIAEGTIVRWIKKVGDAVDRDEPLFEISTDKVDAEIPSPAAGVVTEIRVKEGETVPVNSVVAVIGQAGEAKTTAARTTSAPVAPPPAPAPQADGSVAPPEKAQPEGPPMGGRHEDHGAVAPPGKPQPSPSPPVVAAMPSASAPAPKPAPPLKQEPPVATAPTSTEQRIRQ